MSIGDGIKTYTDSTLMNMSKKELISIIRCLEHNCEGYRETIVNQANHMKEITLALEKQIIKEQDMTTEE